MSGPPPGGVGADPRWLRLTPRRVLAGLGLAALLGFVIVRAAVEDRTPLRDLGVRDLRFGLLQVDPGQTVTQELTWVPEHDVYVVGWNPMVQAPADAGCAIELTLFDAGTRIFVLVQRASPPSDTVGSNPAELPAGTGYRVAAGGMLTLRLRIANQGATEVSTEGAGAQIRYVPAG